jgi:serine/threonine-protein kinase
MLHGPLPIETALDYARQIAEALEDAHEKGVIHRDLKPSNFKVTPEGRAKAWISGWRKRLQATARPALSSCNLLALPVFLIENPLLS